MGSYIFAVLVYGFLISEATYIRLIDVLKDYKYSKFETTQQGIIYVFGFVDKFEDWYFNVIPNDCPNAVNLPKPNSGNNILTDLCDSQTLKMFETIQTSVNTQITPDYHILNGVVSTLESPIAVDFCYFSKYG